MTNVYKLKVKGPSHNTSKTCNVSSKQLGDMI